MIMGCYGIGVGRAAAAVIEQSHDKYGPIWPITIAPFEVQIVGLNTNKEPVREACEALYKGLLWPASTYCTMTETKKRASPFQMPT